MALLATTPRAPLFSAHAVASFKIAKRHAEDVGVLGAVEPLGAPLRRWEFRRVIPLRRDQTRSAWGVRRAICAGIPLVVSGAYFATFFFLSSPPMQEGQSRNFPPLPPGGLLVAAGCIGPARWSFGK